jgi:hypothetical protein
MLKVLCVAAGGLALLYGGGVILAALYDATNPVNTLDGNRMAIGGGIIVAGLLAIILPLTR